MVAIYDISSTEIAALDEQALPDFLGHLLHAEGHLLGISGTNIDTSLRTSDPDAGIDARVRDAPDSSRWIPRGLSVWQFKSGQVGAAKVRSEFRKPGVLEAIRRGGAYCLVLGQDLTPTRLQARETALRRCFDEKGLPYNAWVFAASHVARWASEHPAMALLPYLHHPVHGDLLRWEEWSSQQRFRNSFVEDPQRKAILAEMRKHLNDTGQVLHLRIVGLAGVGKTRLGLEICREQGLRERTLYADNPESIPPGLFGWLEANKAATLILVVDECDQPSADRLVHRTESCEGRMRLVTIGQAQDVAVVRSYPSYVFPLSRLDGDTMQALLHATHQSLHGEAVSFVVRMASGYVKLAITIATALAQHPELASTQDLVQTYDVRRVLDQLILPIQADRRAMQVVALLSRVGWENELASEGRALSQFLGIDWSDSQMRMAQFVNAGLVAKQGRYRYVTPHLLAVWLASEVWEARGREVLELLPRLPTWNARRALLQRLGDLGDEPRAQVVCEELLSADGAFRDLDSLNDVVRSELFAILAEVSPPAALMSLHRILGSCSRDELLSLHDGRRNIVWVLEKLAWLPDTFAGAARLLLCLAEAENETWANNATNAWAGLFRTHLGATAVPAMDRHVLAAEALDSPSIERQLLAVKALACALSIQEWRVELPQGARLLPPAWCPKDWEDDHAVRESALKLLDRALASSEVKVRNAAQEVLLEAAGGLVSIALAEQVLDRLRKLPLASDEQRRTIRAAVDVILRYAGKYLGTEQKQVFESFSLTLLGDTFHDRLRRWVGPLTPADWSIARRAGARPPAEEAALLADEVVQCPDLLARELEWLASGEAQHAYFFGRRLGQLDSDERFWDSIERQARDGQGLLLTSGYLQGHVEAGRQQWRDAVLERWCNEPGMGLPLLDAVARGSPSDEDARRLVSLIRKGALAAEKAGILVWGDQTKDFSTKACRELLESMLEAGGEGTARSALALLAQRLECRPEDADALETIAWTVLEGTDLAHANIISTDAWIRTARIYIADDPARVAKIVLSILEADEPVTRQNPLIEVLVEATRLDPNRVWPQIGETLLSKGARSLRLHLCLQGWYAEHLDPEFLLHWAAANQPRGPRMVAALEPMDRAALHPLARELLIRCEGDKKVAVALSGSLITGVFWGSYSSWLESRLKWAMEWEKDLHPSVRAWARQVVDDLRRQIKEGKLREEEEDLR